MRRNRCGFRAKANEMTGEMSYRLLSNLRDALLNESFIGFTSTPIAKSDSITRVVFDDYI